MSDAQKLENLFHKILKKDQDTSPSISSINDLEEKRVGEEDERTKAFTAIVLDKAFQGVW